MPHALLHLILLLLLGASGGWATATSARTLRIGVPVKSRYPMHVSVNCDMPSNETCYFSGHAIDIFRLVWKNLNNSLQYKFIPVDGSYDSLIQQVYYKKLDAVVGDTSILAKRCKYVAYSQPYTETGARMVVLEKKGEQTKVWTFVKPFTKALWVSIGAIFLYNAIIVWLIESAYNEEKLFSFNQISNLIWLPFNTILPIHGERQRSNLSKMAMVVWLFVALVLTQSYTANLTSMLTVRRLRPSVLLSTEAKIGCDIGSSMSNFLQDVVGFGKGCVETKDLERALSNGTIQAAFLEIASIRFFLDKNPKGFTVIGPTFDIGGYAFAFQKGSNLEEEVSGEILRLRETGMLRTLQEKFLSTPKTSSIEPVDSDENDRLGLDSFWGLFMITGGVSTFALLLFLIGRIQSLGLSVLLMFRPNRIPNKDDQGPHRAVAVRDFRKLNTI